jgi:hypothetical protein
MRQVIPREGSPSAVTREGGNTTEAVTTSTTPVDFLSIASLNIAATTPLQLIVNGRKTTGADEGVGYGLKLNTTVVTEALATLGNVLFRMNDATNIIETGTCVAFVGPRVTNYLRTGVGLFSTYRTSGSISDTSYSSGDDADAPTVTITDLVIRALTGNALVTCGADGLQLYTLATS